MDSIALSGCRNSCASCRMNSANSVVGLRAALSRSTWDVVASARFCIHLSRGIRWVEIRKQGALGGHFWFTRNQRESQAESLKNYTILTMRILALAIVLAGPLCAQSLEYARDIEPIFRSRCYGCHGPQQQMNGLRLDIKDAAMAGGYSGPVIVPGKSAESRLIQRVSS